MTASEFEAQVKVGDRVVLRNDLKHNHVYGGESYIVPRTGDLWLGGMAKPGSEVTVSRIFPRGKNKKNLEFYINNDAEWFYTPEMVDHVVCEEKGNTDTTNREEGMSKQELLEKARVGDTIVLRSDLVDNTKYGDDTYIADNMLRPGSEAVISEIINQIDGKVFIFLKNDRGYWRYTPEMIARVVSSDYSEREKIVKLWIKKVGFDRALRFVDKRLAENDVVKVSDSVVTKGEESFWGCYHWKEYMLGVGKTAKIVNVSFPKDDDIERGNRYNLDKCKYFYSMPMFDIVYVGSRNEHIFNSIEKDLKTGTYVKKELVKTEPTEATVCTEDKVDKHLEYLRRKLADLRHEVEMVEGVIKRLSENE